MTPQLPEFIEAQLREAKYGFRIVTDLGNRVAREYGLVYTLPEVMRGPYLEWGIDLTRFNGDNSWELPVPATFVIDTEGTIRFAEGDPDYTVRPQPEEIAAVVEAL